MVQADQNAARAEWETMLARRDSDSKQFSFIVRGCEGPGLSGSIPHQVFDAEVDSALARMYNGEWDYNKDAHGRATVNSNPAHWPIILDWLSFGTVPSNPTPELLSECSFWQLDRMLSAISEKQDSRLEEPDAVDAVTSREEDSHHFVIKKVDIDDSVGFELQGYICRFQQCIAEALVEKQALILKFSTVGRDWELRIYQKGCHLFLMKGISLQSNLLKFVWSQGTTSVSHIFTEIPQHKAGEEGYGKGFDANDHWYANPKLVSVNGCMQLTLIVTFSSFQA